MTIIEDTRNQKGKHNIKHLKFREAGVKLHRSKIPVGDYCLPPARAIDTKASMLEIAQNIGGGVVEHRRFINELKLAQEIGCDLVILVENEDGIEDIQGVRFWQNPRTEWSPNCIQGPRLAKAMQTIQERYGCTFMFCHPNEAAEIIEDLLR